MKGSRGSTYVQARQAAAAQSSGLAFASARTAPFNLTALALEDVGEMTRAAQVDSTWHALGAGLLAHDDDDGSYGPRWV